MPRMLDVCRIRMVFIDYNWTPILIPFLIGIKKFKNFDKAFRILFFFVLVGVVTEISGLLGRHLFDSKNTMLQSNFYLIVAFYLISWYYIEALRGIVNSKFIWLVIALFSLGVILNLFYHGSLKSYLSVPQTVSKILYLVYSIIFFHKTMLEAKIKHLWKDSFVIINIAVLLYYSGSLFFSILFNLVLDYSREFAKMTIVYFSVLNALFYFSIAWAFLSYSKTTAQNA